MKYFSYFKTGQKGMVVLFLLFSLFQLSPYFILKEKTTIPIVDNLDSYITQYELTATKEFAFCGFDKPVPQIMNGINRDLLVSDLSVISLLFFLFNGFWAYTFNLLLIKIIAFVGMFVFLKNNFSSLNQKQQSIGAFLFSCIPFWPFFGIGIAGQPLLINTFINFHKKRTSYSDYIILLIFPFYSSLVFTNIFIVFGAFVFATFYLVKNKKIPFQLVFATATLFLLGILVEYRLIHATFTPGFVPHRVEFDFAAFVSQSGFGGLLKAGYKLLISGIFHTETFYSVFVIILSGLYLISPGKLKSKNTTAVIFSVIVSIGLLYGLTHSSFYEPLTNKIRFLKTFQIDRFYVLLPFLYFLLAIVCAEHILKGSNRLKKNLLAATTTAAVFILFFNNLSIKALFSSKQSNNAAPTYAGYYDVKMFDELRTAVPFPIEEYRTVALGIDPAVLQFSGFYTLDAYLNIYPLEYKKKFRAIIEKELKKSEDLNRYFNSWGNRCYIYSAEIGYRYDKQSRQKLSVDNLDINTLELKKLYNKDIYLVSTKEIKNNLEIGLEFIRAFSSKSYGNVMLYKVL